MAYEYLTLNHFTELIKMIAKSLSCLLLILKIVLSSSAAPKGAVCKATGPWTGQKAMDNWCVVNCANGFCPSSHCECEVPKEDKTKGTANSFTCRAVGIWKRMKSIEDWCTHHCPLGYCPPSLCKCVGLETTTKPTTISTKLSTRQSPKKVTFSQGSTTTYYMEP